MAFVGVDGAGKSTVTHALRNAPAFQDAGIRRLYFGSNEYWIPGALRLHALLKPIPGLRYIPKVLLVVDRQLRLLRALYYRRTGHLVVCDRYYYDDIVMRRLVREGASGQSLARALLDRIKAFCRPRMWRRPDLTIFLDVSPEVAYQRKQDYPFDLMRRTNALYREVMPSFAEVVVVNADQPKADVQRAVLEHLWRLQCQA